MYFRTLLKRDFDELLAIEQLAFTSSWDEDEVKATLRASQHTAIVAVDRPTPMSVCDRVLGYCFYRLPLPRIEIVRLAVHPDHRRRGVGRALVDRLKDNLRPVARHRLEARVPEVNLPAQQFFRACGLVAEGLRDRRKPIPTILFRYSLRGETNIEGTEVLRSILEGDSRVVAGW